VTGVKIGYITSGHEFRQGRLGEADRSAKYGKRYEYRTIGRFTTRYRMRANTTDDYLYSVALAETQETCYTEDTTQNRVAI
jgi:hypothetical protein